jgi:hypothetical protein
MVQVSLLLASAHGTDHDFEHLPSFQRFCLSARLLQCRQEERRSGRATSEGFRRCLLALPFARARLRPTRGTALLWVGKERTIESFQGFFTTIGQEITSKIVFICSDMWEPYLKVIRENCSESLHILDRFHIVAKMNKALDEVRAGESHRMASEGRTPLLKKSRWLLLKREENLKEEQRFRPRDLLRYNLKTVRAYLLKEAFQQLWDYSSPAWAGKFLDEWCRQTMRSRIEPMKKIARSIRQHRELILNYFKAQKLISSGVVEGLNNKAKVTMRSPTVFAPNWQATRAGIDPRILLTNLAQYVALRFPSVTLPLDFGASLTSSLCSRGESGGDGTNPTV